MNRKVAIKNIIVFSLIFLVGIWLLLTLSSKRGESATVKNLSVPKFSKIDVDTSNADIEIKKGDSYKVIYNGKENTIPDIKVKRDTLQITSPHHSFIRGNIWDLFNRRRRVPLITIIVPTNNIKDVSIDSSNGNVTAKDVIVKQGEIDTSNGSVNISHSDAEGYDLSTSNGVVTFKGKKKGEEYSKKSNTNSVVEIDTSNGNINVN
ncbi:DUF4097 family beta strand repeat-containing protein [Lactobacillus intestinalis]|uniref:DUF4097 family beta strand repeat-containing protein n=1 Tax=Lactobacillus intestinalis TaxID=151781 RepID=UPI000E80D4F0|nr:DUF4097 family beta strand repeat-containing protein [Lactobacillus intestinalis]HBN37357.1 hypothetical protein [Lactobacillus johnsonii]